MAAMTPSPDEKPPKVTGVTIHYEDGDGTPQISEMSVEQIGDGLFLDKARFLKFFREATASADQDAETTELPEDFVAVSQGGVRAMTKHNQWCGYSLSKI